MRYDEKTQADQKEYAEHSVFNELQECIGFYNRFSTSIMFMSAMGTHSAINMDTYVYSSIEGTLESLKHVLKNGRIGDAYALLRKYYDSALINVYVNLYLEDNHSLENFVVQKINDWIRGAKKIPRYQVIMQYIRQSKRLKPISDLLYRDDAYGRIKERCNDHVHYNFFRNVMINDNQIYLKDRLALLTAIQRDLKSIFVLHLSYILFLNNHYMMSSDYMDALEAGMIPAENSQCLVAPFIQNMFSNIIAKERPDIARVIIDSTSMYLDEKLGSSIA